MQPRPFVVSHVASDTCSFQNCQYDSLGFGPSRGLISRLWSSHMCALIVFFFCPPKVLFQAPLIETQALPAVTRLRPGGGVTLLSNGHV